MTAGNDERRPRQGAEPSNRLTDLCESIARSGDNNLQVWATVYYVVGCRGRLRCVLLVRCGFCRRMHQHTAKADFINGMRKASCGHGKYLVHAVAVEGAA